MLPTGLERGADGPGARDQPHTVNRLSKTAENSMRVPLLALQREYAEIEPQLAGLWADALSAMRLLKGNHLDAFEAEIAEYTGSAHAVGVASGTDALALSLIAVGVGPG